jgi:hypothetical protein
MTPLELTVVGTNYAHRWPEGIETYPLWLEYRVAVDNGHRTYRVGFGSRPVYGRERRRVVVWDGDRALVEFFGADDFEVTGDLLAELKVEVGGSVRMCGYPADLVPDRYSGLPIVGLPTRVTGSGVRNAWAVVTNIANHRVILALAALRQLERDQ